MRIPLFLRLLFSAIFLVAAAFLAFGMTGSKTGGPAFYASVLRIFPDGSEEVGAYRFSSGDFRVFTGDFNASSNDGNSGKRMVKSGLESKKVPGLPEGFFAQGFCSDGSGTYVAGGKTGTKYGFAKIFRLNGTDSAVSIAESSEFRFRNCAFGNIGGPVFWAVTHGSGSLYLRSETSGKESVLDIPRVFLTERRLGREGQFEKEGHLENPSGSVLSHFLAFTDLDGDGKDEAYLTVTTPFANSGTDGGMKEFWTVFRYVFTGWLDSGKAEDVGLSQPSSARRLKATEFFGKKELLVLYEHVATDLAPKLYRFSSEGGVLVSRVAFEFPGHRECKTLSESAILPYPTVQIGCDKAALYILKRSWDSFVLDRKVVFGDPTKAGAAKYEPWGNYAIHAILAGDWNSDGKPDAAVAVNNDGIYLADFSRSDPVIWKIAFPKEGDSSDDPYMVMDMAAVPISK